MLFRRHSLFSLLPLSALEEREEKDEDDHKDAVKFPSYRPTVRLATRGGRPRKVRMGLEHGGARQHWAVIVVVLDSTGLLLWWC